MLVNHHHRRDKKHVKIFTNEIKGSMWPLLSDEVE